MNVLGELVCCLVARDVHMCGQPLDNDAAAALPQGQVSGHSLGECRAAFLPRDQLLQKGARRGRAGAFIYLLNYSATNGLHSN